MHCSLDDIKKHLPEERLVELTDDLCPGRGGAVNEEIVGEIISESSMLIDSMIGGRHSLPLKETPPVLKKACVDLSIYRLYERRLDLEDNPGMRKRYDNAMKLLKMIADGEISLGVDESPDGAFFAKSCVSGGGPEFTMNSMRGL
jgi:phage gp36-like protein